MTREEIEKQAKEYAVSKLIDTSNYSPHTRRKQLDYDNYDLAGAFEDGADWRINSVWHAIKEVPRKGSVVLQESNISGVLSYNILFIQYTQQWYRNIHINEVIRWAYLSDLLPQEKGEEK